MKYAVFILALLLCTGVVVAHEGEHSVNQSGETAETPSDRGGADTIEEVGQAYPSWMLYVSIGFNVLVGAVAVFAVSHWYRHRDD